MQENMADEIREWFVACRDQTGTFPVFPDADAGGSRAIFDPPPAPPPDDDEEGGGGDDKKKKGKGSSKKKGKGSSKKGKKGKGTSIRLSVYVCCARVLSVQHGSGRTYTKHNTNHLAHIYLKQSPLLICSVHMYMFAQCVLCVFTCVSVGVYFDRVASIVHPQSDP